VTAEESGRGRSGLRRPREGAHHSHPIFEVGGQGFCPAPTACPIRLRAWFKLAPIEQGVAMREAPLVFSQASGQWGLKGETWVFPAWRPPKQEREKLRLAWRNAARAHCRTEGQTCRVSIDSVRAFPCREVLPT